MIEEDFNRTVRTVEAFHAIAAVLPIYDDEARRVFRLAFKMDIADMIPKFFMDMARLSIDYPAEFDAYLEYIKLLIEYIQNPKKLLPVPADADPVAFNNTRVLAAQLVKSWNIKPYKVEEAK